MTLFVDASAFYAAVDRKDGHHARATRILASGEPLLTTDHVLVETWLVIRRHLGFDTAERFFGNLREGSAAIEPATSADLQVAWTIGEVFADHDFSIVDRTSFAVMQRLGLTRVATFDYHFAVFRYGRDRRRAFEIVS